MKKKKINKENRNTKTATKPHQILSSVDELKADIAAFFDLNKEYSFRPFDVHDHFGVQDRKVRQLFNEILQELEQDKRIVFNPDGTYIANSEKQQDEGLIGKVDRVNKSFAFIVIPDRADDIFVESDLLNNAWDGDTVRVQPLVKNIGQRNSKQSDSKNAKRVEGRVTEIIERKNAGIVGILEVNLQYAIVQPDNKKLMDPIYLETDELGTAEAGDKVIVKIKNWPTRRSQAEGTIESVLGKAGNNDVEMHAILAEFGLPNHFPEEVEQEADKIPLTIAKKELANRRDIRDMLTFTIDPADAKDFDDALSIKYLEDGNFQIGVHIADVSHYVKPNTELEKEAYRRATSVYLVDRTVPMLPAPLRSYIGGPNR